MKFKGEEVTFLGFLDNVWYHFKAHILIGAAAVIFLLVGVTQCATRDEHDVFIYSVGYHNPTAKDSDLFMRDMERRFTVDMNGDGKKVVDMKVDHFVMAQDGGGNSYVFNASHQVSESEAFQLELSMGECIVYIIEPAFFYSNLNYLTPLSEALGYVPENALEGKGLRVGDLPAYTATMYFCFPEDYIICLADRDRRYSDEYFESNVAFFKNLIEYK